MMANTSKGNVSSFKAPATPDISDDQVQAAAAALGVGKDRGFGSGGAIDGRSEKSKAKDLNPESTENNDEAKVARSVPRPDDQIMKMINDAIKEIEALETERSQINAEISAIIEKLESDGINRHAFRYAKKVAGMSEKNREGLDLSYILVRRATGLPVQTDWIEEQKVKTH